MQLSFRHGIIRCQTPSFLRVQDQTVDLLVGDASFLYTICDKNKDYVFTEPRTVNGAWGPLPSYTVWLYVDIDVRTAVRTFGFSAVAPVISATAPTSPAVGQHWFNLTNNTMSVHVGQGRWQRVVRLFVAKMLNGVTPVSISINSPSYTGTNVGLTSETEAGYLMFDSEGAPLTSNGTFVTTVDRLKAATQSVAEVAFESMPVAATADETISAYTVVKFVGFGRVAAATPAMSTDPTVFGIVDVNALVGDVVNVRVTGLVTNPAWDWTAAGVNAVLYVGADAQLTATPTEPNQVGVAMVVDRDTVHVGAPVVNNYTTVIGSGGGDNSDPATTTTAGSVRISVPAVNASDPIAVGTNDPRLTDSRAPTAHTHSIADVSTLSALLSNKLGLSGGTLTGPLILASNPTSALDAVTKQYVDAIATSTTSIPSQAGQDGKVLTTNGSALSWTPISGYTLVPATSSTLGGIKIGSGLTIDGTGTVSTSAVPLASSSQFGVVRVGIGLRIDELGNLATESTPYASSSVAGVIKVGSGLSVDGGVLSVPEAPTASPTVAGVIKVGSGLSVDGAGILSTTAADHATSSQFGVVRVGTGLQIDGTGSLITTPIPVATTTTTGVIKVGSGLSVNGDGVVVTDPQPYASAASAGVVKVGSGLSIDGTGTLALSLPTASASAIGGVKIGTGLVIDGAGVLSVVGGGSGGDSYVLPAASSTVLGGIKLGSGLSMDGDGVVSIVSGGTYVLPPATSSTLGGIKVGSGLNVDVDGVISVPSLSAATSSTLGGIKVGSGLAIDGFGVLSTSGASYVLPPATQTVLGGVKVGSGLDVDVNGAISLAALPSATVSTAGVVKVGTGLSIDGNGVLSATALAAATTTDLGGVKVGTGLSIDGNGVLSATAEGYTLTPATQTVLGGVKVGSGLNVDVDGAISLATLPSASSTVAGVIKVGSGLSMAGDGTLSTAAIPVATASTAGTVIVGSGLTVDAGGIVAATPYALPHASSTNLGGIKVGSGMSIDVDGALTYALPTASASVIGGVRVGSGLAIDGSGILSATATAYTLPTAAANVLGGIKIGSGLSIDGSGVVSATATTYTLPTSSASTLGGIKIGTGLSIDGTGVVSVSSSSIAATTSTYGTVKIGTGLQLNGTTGALEVSSSSGGISPATTSTLGGLILGTGLYNPFGYPAGTVAVRVCENAFDFASSTFINNAGLVKIVNGSGLARYDDGTGRIKIAPATDMTLGGIMGGRIVRLASDGTLMADKTQYVVSKAYGNPISMSIPSDRPEAFCTVTGTAGANFTCNICISNMKSINTVSPYVGVDSQLDNAPFETIVYVNNPTTKTMTVTFAVMYTGVGNGTTNAATVSNTWWYPSGTPTLSLTTGTTKRYKIRCLDNGANVAIEESVVTGAPTTFVPWFVPIYTAPGSIGDQNWFWATDSTAAVNTSVSTNSLNTTNDYATVPIPSLRVFGTTYTDMYVGTNGYITFGTPKTTAVSNATALGVPAISLLGIASNVALLSCKYGTSSSGFRCRMKFTAYSGMYTVIVEFSMDPGADSEFGIAYFVDTGSIISFDGGALRMYGLTDGSTYRGATTTATTAGGWGANGGGTEGSSGWTYRTLIKSSM